LEEEDCDISATLKMNIEVALKQLNDEASASVHICTQFQRWLDEVWTGQHYALPEALPSFVTDYKFLCILAQMIPNYLLLNYESDS
jgi:hypothetical protein